MFINKSKIHFESKSQLKFISSDFIPRCLSISQRYILKANHNYFHCFMSFNRMFINKSKIHFESKSQLVGMWRALVRRCLSISQRYILKANHNSIAGVTRNSEMFINKSKIHFESKSQHPSL